MAQTPSTYSYRRQIVIDHTKVANSDQSNFPVLISGTYSFLATVANGGKVQNASGYDIIFSTDVAGSNKLDHEIESYDPATGTINFWVRIPTLSHTTDTVIYVQYGNGAISTSQENKTGVWDGGYRGVWHLGNLADSTVNGFSLTNNNSVGAVPGPLGRASSFNGVNQFLTNPALSIAPGSSITISYWELQSANKVQISSAFTIGGSEQPNRIQAHSPYSDRTLYWDYGDFGNGSGRVTTDYTPYLDSWSYITLEFDAGAHLHRIYINGAARASAVSATTPNATQTGISIGAWAPGAYLNANLAEFRVSTVARSSDWIATEYNNQNTSSTFYSIGTESASMVVLPSVVFLTKGQTQQFVATVVGVSDSRVSWSVNPAGAGSIDSTGLYTAPAVIGATQSVTITATSAADNTKTAIGTVTLVPPYNFRRGLTIDHTKVQGSDQSNFPVLISGTYGFLATVANGGKVQSASGYDIIFSTDVAGSNKLDHEIESYDPATGTIYFWVRIPALSHTTDTVIYVQYGNGAISTSQENKVGVWDGGYRGVWHLGNLSDSTVNGLSLTNNNSVGTVSGPTGSASSFNGVNQFLSNTALSIAPGSSITISYWELQSSNKVQNSSAFTIGGSEQPNRIQAHSPYSDRTLYWDYGAYSNGSGRVTTDYTPYLDSWSYVTLEFDASASLHRIYINGAVRASIVSATTPTTTQTGIDIGAWAPAVYQNGNLEEFRVSTVARSSDWIATEYNNQNSPSAFYSIGSENASVVVLPEAVSLKKVQTQQFTATLVGANQAVTWSIGPSGAGSIDNTGLYTAPSSISANTVVTIVATSAADSSKTGSAVVNLIGPYNFRRAISIDHTKVPNTDQSSFPLLISGSYSFLATVGNGGKVQNPKGYDIIFSSDAAGFNKLDHEIESYDPVTGLINFWVRIPTLSHTTDSLIYLQYGQSLITTSQENRTGVWDGGYRDVLHFAGGTALSVGDSTSNSNSGSNGGATEVAGKISGAAAFTGSQSIALPSLGNTSGETKLTMSAWVNATSTSGLIFGESAASGVFGPSLSISGSTFVAQAANPGLGSDSAIDTSAMAAGNWNYVVGVFEEDGINLYVNGVKKATAPYRYAGGALSNNSSWLIGSVTGNIDEVRFSSVVRSADWIAAEYNNQSSPSTFYSLGGENAIRIFITPSAPSLYGGQSQQFTPTLINTANLGVSWATNPSGIGSINASGLYTPPPTVTSKQTVAVTATSLADSAQTAQATITLYPPLQVSVSPISQTFSVGQKQQFAATVSNAVNTGVTWTLSPPGLGSISSAGLYTAPSTIAAQQAVTVTATSVVDNSTSASASVTLTPASTVYGYRRTITIDHNKVPNTLLAGQGQTNFPVLISGTYGYLASAANGGKVLNPNGYDIIFTSDALGTNQLDHEIETYDPATGTINFWVRVPGISFTADTVIYMHYGNASVTASGENKTGVWDSNYQMVLHLGESAAPYRDSTRNAFSSVGGVAPTQSGGKIGRGQSFDGASQYIAYPGQQSPSPEGAITMGAWVKTNDASAAGRGVLGKWENDHDTIADQSYELFIAGGSPNGLVLSTDGHSGYHIAGGLVADGNWHYVVVAAEPFRTVSIYVDGVLTQFYNMNNVLLNPVTDRLLIGATNLAYTPYFMNGVIDEARISNSTRSADWIAAEYNNQSSPATFYAVGAEQTAIVLSPVTSSLYAGQTQQFAAAGVRWSVSPSGIGSIDASGLYIAPAAVTAEQTVAITATSLTDSTKSASATVTLLPSIALSVLPSSASLSPSQTQQFTAAIANTQNASVRWSLSPSGSGRINSVGLYVAPAEIDSPQSVNIIATSVADPTKSANSIVTLLPAQNVYHYRRAIVIDHTKVPNSDLNNFPLLISGTYSDLAGSVHGGAVQSPSGYDIVFSTDAAGSNKLDHEIESYDPATGTINFWVRLPALSHTTDTVIYIQYGNSAITTSQENKTGVWDSNYQMVLHLDEPGYPYKDSASSGFSSTGGVYPTQATGKIGQGQSFNGTSQYIGYSQAQSPNPTGAITLETWIKTPTTSLAAIFGKWGNDGPEDAHQAYELYIDSNAMPGVALNSTNSSDVIVNGTTHISDGTWHHLVATAPSTGTVAFYVDGQLSNSLNNTNPLLATAVDRLLIGTSSVYYGTFYLNGVLDEVRISNSVRSSDWVATEYNNQSSPATFYSLGPASALFVSALTPDRGEPGASITISGSSFGTSGSVTFNGQSATVSAWSDTSITTVVPNGAVSGPVTVTSGGVSSNGAPFRVLSPIISGLNPNHGSTGASVTIAGGNFGAGAGTVTFGGQIASVSSWSDSSITVAAPNSNPGNVVVSNSGLQSNAVGFNTPTIISLSPGSSLPGSSVTITGGGFGSNGTVTFAGGATAITTSWSDSSITATVPPGAVNGNVVVTVSGATSNGVAFLIQQPVVNGPILYSYDQVGRLVGMTAASGDAVQYSYDAVGNILAITHTAGNQPAILSFRPTSGPVGTQVTVSGSGFSATASQNAVSFNGVAAAVNSATSVQLVATVPSGATSGVLAITSPGGSATGSSLFTVTTAAIGTSITNFSPQLQNQGQAVTISGSGFDTQAGNNHVMVNTTPAAMNGAAGATSLSILAPAAGSGRIRVITPAGVAVSTGDLYIVPFGSNISDVAYTGRANLGDTVTVTLNTSGFGLLLFDGKVGDSVSVSVGSSSLSACTLQLYQPNGSLVGSSGSCAAAGSLQAQALPVTGAYTLRVSPSGGATGSAQLTLTNASDVVNSIASGSVSTVTTSVSGQKGRLTFTGKAGQQVTIQLTANTFGSVAVSLVNSAGTAVSTITSSSAVFSLPKVSLAATDQYTILIEPAAPGSIQVGLTVEGNGNTEPPLRPAGAVLDPSSPLAAGLKGLFLMNEGTGSSTQNLIDGQAAVFSGGVQPVWSGGSLLLSGGASLNSYLDAGGDVNFDQLTTGRMTIVAKVHLLTTAAGSIPGGGIAEKNDGDIDSGFVIGINSNGAIEAIVEKSSQDMEIASPASAVVSAGWMQVAFTWDGTQGTAAAAHLFLNGVEQSKAEASDGAGYIGFANATNQPFRIGNAGFDLPGSLNGLISYLAVYKDRILTPAELGQLDTQLPIK